MIIYGHRLMGKTDVVPGRFHVATKFYHIDYVPLIPASSHLIFEQTATTYRGVRIPLSGKSILFAYGKLLAVLITAFGGLVFAFRPFDETLHRDSPVVLAMSIVIMLAGVSLFCALTWLKPLVHASPARARKLCQAAGLTAEQTDKLLPDMTDGFQVITGKTATPVLPVLPQESI